MGERIGAKLLILMDAHMPPYCRRDAKG